MAAGASWSGSQLLTVRTTVAVGGWYLLLQVDYDGYVSESDETNNILAVPITLVCFQPELVQTVSFGVWSSDVCSSDLSVDWTVVNQGDGAAGHAFYRDF